MWTDTIILAQDDTFSQLAYVIAVLVLAGLGGLTEWFKKRQAEVKNKRGPDQVQPPGPRAEQPDALDRWREIPIPPPAEKRPEPRKPPRRPVPARHPRPAGTPAGQPVPTARRPGPQQGSPRMDPLVGQSVSQQVTHDLRQPIAPSSVQITDAKMPAPPVALIGPPGQMSVKDWQRAFIFGE
ncbi:MAG TPA: hypothetical protein VLM89_14180, partial [Phycisphaerae bacterium]|nr:hypothetical protein [Phycisphaerae bacterium]